MSARPSHASSVSRLLAAPVFDDRAKTRAAKLLNDILLSGAGILLVVIVVAPLLSPTPVGAWLARGALLGIALLGLALLRRGFVRTVTVGLVAAVWLVLTVSALLLGGVRSPLVVLYPVVVLLAGLTWGRRPAVALALLSALAGAGMTWAGSQGLLPESAVEAWRVWTGLAGALALVAVLMHIALKAEEERQRSDRRLQVELAARRETEEALSEQVRRNLQLLGATMDGYVLADTHGAIKDVNPAYCELVQYSRDELLRMNIGQLDAQLTAAELEQRTESIVGRGADRFETKHCRKDGAILDLDVSGIVMRTRDGPWIAAFVRDTTERRRVQRALEASEERLNAFFSHAPSGLALLDSELRYTHVNPYLATMNGRSVEEHLGKTPADVLDVIGAHVETLVRGVRDSREPVFNLEMSGQVKGAMMHFVASVFPIPGPGDRVGVGAVVVDITERKRAEKALRESEARYRVVFENSPAGVIVVGRDGGIRAFNRAMLEPGGYAPEDIARLRSVEDLYADPQDRARIWERFQEDGFVQGMDVRLRAKDGGTYDAAMSLNSLVFGGEPCVIAHIQDVTERKRVERALVESERRFRRLADNAPAIIYRHRLGENPGFDYISPAVEAMTGYGQQEFYEDPGLGQRIVHPEDRARLQDFVRGVLPPSPHVARWICRDGTIIWTEDRSVPVYDDRGALVAVEGIALDITRAKTADAKLRESREQLRQLAARLQAVREEERATIAREIHDELGQALTGIKIDLSWLAGDAPRSWSRVRERSSGLFALVDSAIDTVRELATRLRPAVLDDLGLAAAVEWQAQDIAKRTGLTMAVTTPPDDVPLDRDQATALFRILQEALTNVVRHADATHGVVELRCDDTAVILEVTDNGRGIGEESAGAAESLGLLGMRERAAAFGGTVTVAPGPEGGTRVTATVPRDES